MARSLKTQPALLLINPFSLDTTPNDTAPAKGNLFQYDGPLSEVDPEVAGIIKNEKNRQVSREKTQRERRARAARRWCCRRRRPPAAVFLFAAGGGSQACVEGVIQLCGKKLPPHIPADAGSSSCSFGGAARIAAAWRRSAGRRDEPPPVCAKTPAVSIHQGTQPTTTANNQPNRSAASS